MIGITTSSNHDGDFFLRRQYCSAVLRAGGIPIMLPPVGRPTAALGIIDGLLFSGGGDIAPRLCGITDYDPMLLFEVFPERDEYELELAALAYQRDIPTLGICRGVQVLNAALGGSLYFDIPGHRQTLSREQPSHSVSIASGSLLHRLIGARELEVNSFHHQAVDKLAEPLRVCAVSADGIIEALEAPDNRFCLGVQWHPEHMNGFAAEVLFAALCAAAAQRGY
ncbi:MAG: gamma-glutamyl-gamma-aminobutyrate hydrolase family protein [Clostridia bacterium]|nr:gamma-glutamyl-gamma-aminobutyrate hydrolase family protein [Clostridia bacterium]